MSTRTVAKEMPVSTTDSIASAPLPTARTLARRKNLAFQAFRFVVINLKMIRVIARGHG